MSQIRPDAWPISTYWCESPERVSQHWYISFCLLMSAVQDYLIGTSLKHSRNANWAVKCSVLFGERGDLLAKLSVFVFQFCDPSQIELFSGRFHRPLRTSLSPTLSDARGPPLEPEKNPEKVLAKQHGVCVCIV